MIVKNLSILTTLFLLIVPLDNANSQEEGEYFTEDEEIEYPIPSEDFGSYEDSYQASEPPTESQRTDDIRSRGPSAPYSPNGTKSVSKEGTPKVQFRLIDQFKKGRYNRNSRN